MTITAKELLDIKLEGTDLRGVFYTALDCSDYGSHICIRSAAEEETFYLTLAQKLIDAIKDSK